MSTETIHDVIRLSSESSFIVAERHSIASSEKSRVRFSPRVSCRATLTRYEYTYKEARNTWLFPDEKANVMEKYVKTAQRMKSGKKPTKNSTYRGLESIEERKGISNACVHAVLDEQGIQWEEDTFRGGRFAKISRRCSKDSKALALKRANSDEREVKKAYRQMESDREENSFHSTLSFSVESFRSPQSIKSRRRKFWLGTPCSRLVQIVPVL
jgi:hypothetical protein